MNEMLYFYYVFIFIITSRLQEKMQLCAWNVFDIGGHMVPSNFDMVDITQAPRAQFGHINGIFKVSKNINNCEIKHTL